MANLRRIKRDDKVGYENDKGEIILAPEYEDGRLYFGIDSISHTPYCNVCKDGKCGIVDEEGNIVVPFVYQEAYHLFDDLFAVRKEAGEYNETWLFGVINSAGDVIIPFTYKLIVSEGCFINCCESAYSKRKYDYELMDIEGKIYDYSQITGDVWFNRDGKKIYEGEVIESQQDYMMIERNDHYGLIDQQGIEVLPAEYDDIHCINSKIAVVRKTIEDDWYFGVVLIVPSDTGILVPFKYKYIEETSEYFFQCYKQCECVYHPYQPLRLRYEYSNKKETDWYNKEGILLHSGEARLLNPNIIAIEKNGLWGAYNQACKRIVNFQFDDIRPIQDNLLVRKDNLIGLLDSNGEVIISPTYKSIECVNPEDETYGDWALSNKSYGCYSVENPFDSESPAKMLYRKRAYLVESYPVMRLFVSGEDGFKWDSPFILSTDNYAELFTIKDGIIAGSRFESIFHITQLSYVVKKDNKWGVYRKDAQKLIIPCEYDRIVFEGGHVVLLCNDGLWGVKTLVLPTNIFYFFSKADIPCQYLEIKILDSLQHLYGVKYEWKNYYGEPNINYKIVGTDGEQSDGMRCITDTDAQYELFDGERILSSRNGKWGFVSLRGYDSIPFKYDSIAKREDGNFDVQIGERWGVIDLRGKELTAIKYLEKIPASMKQSIVQDYYSGRYGVLSEDGTEIVPTIYEHLFIENDLIFFGYGGMSGDNFFSNVEYALWGCMDLSGNQIIPADYQCYIVQDGYILAGRNGSFMGNTGQEYQDKFSGVYDLYNLDGELLFGGFDKFKLEGDYFFFLLNGSWESYAAYDDDWNNIHEKDYYLNEKNAMWLPLDSSLMSVKLGKDGERVKFRKGFIAKIRKENKNNKTINYYNLDITTLVKKEPSITGDYLLTQGDGLSQAIRLCDGAISDLYDEIQLYCDNLFFVRKGYKVGIVSFENEVLLPIEYFALTLPVSGCVFAFKELDNSSCAVDFIYAEGNGIIIQHAISSRKSKDVVDEILYGMYKITILPKGEGLKRIGVYRPSIFDEEFANRIDKNEHGEFYSKYKIHYWFSNDYSLLDPDRDYDGGCEDDGD